MKQEKNMIQKDNKIRTKIIKQMYEYIKRKIRREKEM